MEPEDDSEGMKETLHLLASPANAERLRRSIEQLEAGFTHPLPEPGTTPPADGAA
ncbi:MAG TPA: hypothetical protein VEB20_10170 [Azospirillaceae bacterium]|nr:hypothetical protein [Azospirillaceae bacterium]